MYICNHTFCYFVNIYTMRQVERIALIEQRLLIARAASGAIMVFYAVNTTSVQGKEESGPITTGDVAAQSSPLITV